MIDEQNCGEFYKIEMTTNILIIVRTKNVTFWEWNKEQSNRNHNELILKYKNYNAQSQAYDYYNKDNLTTYENRFCFVCTRYSIKFTQIPVNCRKCKFVSRTEKVVS